MSLPRIFRLALLLCISLASLALHAADATKALDPHFRRWLNDEVTYIISSGERQQFLSLKSDAERDSFIQAFWQARDPNPGSTINIVKEEHYRRLAYANQQFGSTETQDGWRTDQGRIYITLGEPQQKVSYPNSRNVRPILIWFYESTTPALPSHFNVVFYKRSAGEPFTLYSPYQDGPSRLTTGLEDLNLQQKSIQTIRKSLGDEVAKTTLSLIPTEPVDLNDYKPSLTSDVLLASIKGLPDNPLTKELRDAHRSTELVSGRILTSPVQAELTSLTFRDAAGGQTAYFLFEPKQQSSNVIESLGDGKLGYDLTLAATVTTKDGKGVYQTNETLRAGVSESQASDARTKRFAAEGSLPLVHGEYKLTVKLINNISKVAVEETKPLFVPDLSKEHFNVSTLLAYSKHSPGPIDRNEPFHISGIRFVPRSIGEVSLHPAEPLSFAFQLWTHDGQAIPSARTVKMTYAFGKVGGSTAPTSESETLSLFDRDAAGNILSGHVIPTIGFEPGTYRLVVTANDEATGLKSFSTMSFRIVPASVHTDLWTVFGSDAGGSKSEALDDYKRGLSALAQMNDSLALSWFEHAMTKDPQNSAALERVVTLLSKATHFTEVANLSNTYGSFPEITTRTAVLMAEAQEKTGNLTKATQILEEKVAHQSPDPHLYLLLARLYQASGDSTRAEVFNEKARLLGAN